MDTKKERRRNMRQKYYLKTGLDKKCTVRYVMLRVFITWQMKISYVSYSAQYWYASMCKHFLYDDKAFVL